MAGGGLRAGRPEKPEGGVHGLSFGYELMAVDQCLLLSQPSPLPAPVQGGQEVLSHLLDSGLGPSLGASPMGRVRGPPSKGVSWSSSVRDWPSRKEAAEPRPHHH